MSKMKHSMLRLSVWVSSEKERKKTKDMAIQINDRQWKENEYVFDKKAKVFCWKVLGTVLDKCV